MANLTESATYDAGVYQLETTDPVAGGAAGISNSPLKNLANRTKYLKAHVDALETAASGYAPLASPNLTGSPTAPTQALGDNSTKVATDAFVQATVGGRLEKSVSGGANITLTAVEAGNAILEFSGVLTANIAVIVPTSPTRPWIVKNATSGAYTLTVKTAAGTGIICTQGKTAGVFTDGTNVYDSLTDFDSPALTGTPTAPTATTGTNTTQVASTAFVQAQLASSVPTSSETVAGKIELATAAETTTGTDSTRAVHPAGLKVELDKKAPLASPTFSGDPTAPTAAQFDNDKSVATTEFVQRALGNLQTSLIWGGGTLTAAQCGKLISLGTGSSILPLLSACPDGGALFFVNTGGGDHVLNRQGTDTISPNGSALTSITIASGDDLLLVKKTGGDYWMALFGSARLKYSSNFGSSLAANGYQKLPSGLIIQWGSVTTSAASTVTATFPITFPNVVLSISALCAATAAHLATINTPITTGVQISGWTSSTGARVSTPVYWFAVGH